MKNNVARTLGFTLGLFIRFGIFVAGVYLAIEVLTLLGVAI
jgi:hypothetical protein